MLTSRKAYAEIKKEFGGSGPLFSFIKLCRILLSEARLRQDTAEGDELIKNQGSIKELKSIIKNLEATGERYQYTESYQS